MPRNLFAGGGLDTAGSTAGTVTEITTGGTFDSTYFSFAVNCSGPSSNIKWYFRDESTFALTTVGNGETLEVKTTLIAGTGTAWSSTSMIFAVIDSSGNPWVAIRGVAGDTIGLFVNTNTGASPTWTQVGSNSVTNDEVTLRTFRIRVKIVSGGAHEVEAFENDVSFASGTQASANLTTLAGMSGHGFGTTGNHRYSEVMAVEGRSLANAHVTCKRASGVGFYTAWTGAFTDVNEVPLSDATTNNTAVAGNKQSYAFTNITSIPTGTSLVAVFYWIRANHDGVSPLNIKAIRRQSSTDTTSGNLSGLAVGITNLPVIYTGLTVSDVDNSEFGFESAA